MVVAILCSVKKSMVALPKSVLQHISIRHPAIREPISLAGRRGCTEYRLMRSLAEQSIEPLDWAYSMYFICYGGYGCLYARCLCIHDVILFENKINFDWYLYIWIIINTVNIFTIAKSNLKHYQLFIHKYNNMLYKSKSPKQRCRWKLYKNSGLLITLWVLNKILFLEH